MSVVPKTTTPKRAVDLHTSKPVDVLTMILTICGILTGGLGTILIALHVGPSTPETVLVAVGGVLGFGAHATGASHANVVTKALAASGDLVKSVESVDPTLFKDISGAVSTLQSNVSTITGVVSDVPGLKALIDSLTSQVDQISAKVDASTGVDPKTVASDIVKQILAQYATGSTPSATTTSTTAPTADLYTSGTILPASTPLP